MKVSEAQTQRLILDWLAAKGILAFRQNTGAVRSSYKGKERFMRFGVPGMADIQAFPKIAIARDMHPVLTPTWIEVKAPKGKQSDLQKSFQELVEAHGHKYIVAYSLEDVEKAL